MKRAEIHKFIRRFKEKIVEEVFIYQATVLKYGDLLGV